jgi:hypothetical protein
MQACFGGFALPERYGFSAIATAKASRARASVRQIASVS